MGNQHVVTVLFYVRRQHFYANVSWGLLVVVGNNSQPTQPNFPFTGFNTSCFRPTFGHNNFYFRTGLHAVQRRRHANNTEGMFCLEGNKILLSVKERQRSWLRSSVSPTLKQISSKQPKENANTITSLKEPEAVLSFHARNDPPQTGLFSNVPIYRYTNKF